MVGGKVELGLSWDFFEGMPIVDLDAQAVLFDAFGNMVDAAFYNQLAACDGAVTHSGDNRTGDGDGDDESINVDLDALPASIKSIVFVVTAYSGGTFKAVETARGELRSVSSDGSKQVKANVFIGGHGNNTALIMCILVRNSDGTTWNLVKIGRPTEGRHF